VVLKDKDVLLTGASGGIGGALARRFAAEGARLVLSGRRGEELAALAEEVGGRYVVADLAVPGDVARLAEEAGGVDVLVANAGLPGTGKLASFSPVQVDRAIDVNLRAPIALAHALAPAMTARGRGAMVFVSSLAGLTAGPSTSLYNATKFGLRGFALALHDELAPAGVSVSVVLPGFISDAGMFAEAAIEAPTFMGTRTPDQVADAVLKALRTRRAEVLVAPPLDRFGAKLGTVAPNLASKLKRRGLLGDFGEEMAPAHQHKR
jgi:short-subunit dehydrogenase